MNSVTVAQQGLNYVKEDVIGISKNRGSFELILEENGDGTLDTIRITEFGIIQQNFCSPTTQAHWILFPDGKNMATMLNDVNGWVKFMKQFDI